jgi:NAD(P)-dependent dehydrogenase (short-subunit alcohol dehydrogenase family)
MIDLAGCVAVVTGAGRGLGRAYALALAGAGARVVVNDVGCASDGSGTDPDIAEAVAAEIIAAGGAAVADATAVGTAEAGAAIVSRAVAAFGRLDVLVTNAGVSESHPFADFPAAPFDAVVRVHLGGTFGCARAAFAQMVAQGRGGRIITVASGAALDTAYPGTAAYAAAKGAIVALTRVIAVEGAAHGITCNAVAPVACTRMSEGFLAGRSAGFDPARVAPLVVYLASAASSTVTGEVFRMPDAGLAVARVTTSERVLPARDAWSADEIAARIGEILGRGR